MSVKFGTRGEFLHFYVENSGMTLTELTLKGLRAVRCACAEEECRGWKMIAVPEGFMVCPNCSAIHHANGRCPRCEP